MISASMRDSCAGQGHEGWLPHPATQWASPAGAPAEANHDLDISAPDSLVRNVLSLPRRVG